MKKYSVIITSIIISVLFIFVTGWIAFGHAMSVSSEFAFLFHLIPFGIGFAGGASILIFLYYLLLCAGISLLISPIVRAFYSSKSKTKFLTFSTAPLVLIAIIVVYIDYSKNKEREERIAMNNRMNKADFHHLRTGDLLFQKTNKNNSLISDSSYYNIGIAFIDGDNYALLETKGQVQYVSIRQWVENGNNNNYFAKRLRNADSLFTNSGIQVLDREARSHIMKKFDNSIEWSDEEMYNAELIWKIYKRAFNVELGSLDTIKVDTIKRIEIRPNTIFNSKHLITVKKE
ncbi:MAG TPA: YiiX/YebB-like N1pC/P60 family cysteine hydrolase [Flavobacteriales bacterium]|nr:YiiX/YebB-like N1pC/P60 family cysteine hydrolase [Flavobacteriales bacterium]